MAIWQIDFFASEDDTEPYRRCFVNGASEDEAVQLAIDEMRDDPAATLSRKATSVSSIPTGVPLWVGRRG